MVRWDKEHLYGPHRHSYLSGWCSKCGKQQPAQMKTCGKCGGRYTEGKYESHRRRNH